MRPSDQASAAAEYTCTRCSKTYARSSHLRRHEATHTGNRSSNCPLCNRAFARSDVARRHVKACAIKQNRPLPPQRRRGTPRQACDNCARAKSACDRSPVCSSCRSHGLTCSYNRISGPDSAFSAPPLDNSGRSDSEKLSVSFLLSFTDPRTPASSDLIVSQSLLEPLSSHSSTSDYFVLQDDEVAPEGYLNGCNGLLSKFSLGFWDEDDGASAAECRPQPQAEPCLSALANRAEQLISELASFHHKLYQFDPPNAPFFDRMQARQVFTATNLKKLSYASFIPFSRHHALLHWPSFDPGAAALPLVLAVFMLGSVFSVPTDDALSARQFLNISEEYIFCASSLQSLVRGESQLATFHYQIMLEHVQAALLICSTQLSMNNRQTRRRIRMQRHPATVAAVRSLLSIKVERPAHLQSAYSEWQAFLVSELRVRLLYVAFMNDAMLTIHFNHVPLITLTELNGPLPCVDALFEAENAKVYSNLRAEAAAAGNPPSSLAAFVELLMKDNWTPADDIKLEGLTIRHLMGAVAALNTTLFALRSNNCLGLNTTSISRALTRWKVAWDAALSRTTTDFLAVGFMRHADAFWWLATSTLKLFATNQESKYRYLADMTPRDDVEDMHAFIKGLIGIEQPAI